MLSIYIEKKVEEKKEEKKDEPPPQKAPPKAAPSQAAPTSSAPADPNAPIGSNGKPKKKIKRIVKTKKLIETKDDNDGADGIKKGVGGLLSKPIDNKSLSKKFKPPKKWKEGSGYDKVLEDYSKDVACFGSFKKMDFDKILEDFKKKKWIDSPDEIKEKKMEKKLEQAKLLFEAAMKQKKFKNDEAKGIIIAIANVMGWETTNSKNPNLSEMFLKLLTHVLNNSKIDRKKDRGIFDQFVPWIMERLGQPRYNKLATELLLSTAYQFGANVVFAKIEQELADKKKKHCKGDKNFGPIVGGVAEMIRNFGMYY